MSSAVSEQALPAGAKGSTVSRTSLLSEAMVLLSNVTQLRFIRTSDEVLALGRARMFETVESSLASGEPELAKAIAATVLENNEAGTSLLRLSPAESARVRALIAEVHCVALEFNDEFFAILGDQGFVVLLHRALGEHAAPLAFGKVTKRRIELIRNGEMTRGVASRWWRVTLLFPCRPRKRLSDG